MSRTKTGLLVLAACFLLIQFIHPKKNQGNKVLRSDITNIYPVPKQVLAILKRSCYDCHSNNTSYPWYNNIQPVAWWLASHIKEGKEELNFNEFGNYSARRQKNKLKGIANSIEEGGMPLGSYLWIHTNAKLSGYQKKLVISWARQTSDSISNHAQ